MRVKENLDAAVGSYPRTAVWNVATRDEAGKIMGENSVRGTILGVDETSFEVRPEHGADYSQAIVDVSTLVFIHK